MENYFFETDTPLSIKKIYILVIYDIVENKRRLKFAKTLEGFGIRVQRSCFEAFVTEPLYLKLIHLIPGLINNEEDSVRVYRIVGSGEVTVFGNSVDCKAEDVIII